MEWTVLNDEWSCLCHWHCLCLWFLSGFRGDRIVRWRQERKAAIKGSCQLEGWVPQEYLNTFRCKSVAARPHNLSPLTKVLRSTSFNMMIIAGTGENYGDRQWCKWCRFFDLIFFRDGDLGRGEHWDVVQTVDVRWQHWGGSLTYWIIWWGLFWSRL